MFLANSEIAVATTARSVEGKPQCDASSRPFCRAETMSASESMGTRTSSAMSANLMVGALHLAVKAREALFQVQRGRHALEREPELDHREGHLRLDPHADGLRAAQPDHVGHVAQGTGRERIDHVERRDVHDDPAGPDFADLRSEEHTSELQSRSDLVCRLLLEKKKLH